MSEFLLKPGRSVLVVGGVVLCALACILAVVGLLPASTKWWTNGAEIRVLERGAPLRRILWQPAQPVLSPVGTMGADADEYEPRISADGTTMLFVRRRAGTNADIYSAQWGMQGGTWGWSEPTPIASINTDADELGPELARDGKSLYFYSDRAGGLGGYDLWFSRLSGTEWGSPANLGPAINTPSNEYGPALTPDGKRLYFSSNRLRPGEVAPRGEAWSATIRERNGRHDYDLYESDISNEEPGEATALLELNTLNDEGAPAMSPVGDFLYFASDRPAGSGGLDVYRVRRQGNKFGAVENLGDAVNSPANDLDPGLSTDGFRLYFSSDRAMGSELAGNGDSRERTRYGLWQTGSREVFEDVEKVSRGAGLSNLWSSLWPWILAFLLGMLPLIALWQLWKNEAWRRRMGRLSLLAQCLLISILIHAMILSGLSVWKVGAGIAEAIGKGGGTQVILTSSGGAGDITTQIRGGGSDLPAMPITLESMAAEVEAGPVEVASVQSALSAIAMPPEKLLAAQIESTPVLAQIPQPITPPALQSIAAALPATKTAEPVREATGEQNEFPRDDFGVPSAPVVGTFEIGPSEAIKPPEQLARIDTSAIRNLPGVQLARSGAQTAAGLSSDLSTVPSETSSMTAALPRPASNAAAVHEPGLATEGGTKGRVDSMAPVAASVGVPTGGRSEVAVPRAAATEVPSLGDRVGLVGNPSERRSALVGPQNASALPAVTSDSGTSRLPASVAATRPDSGGAAEKIETQAMTNRGLDTNLAAPVLAGASGDRAGPVRVEIGKSGPSKQGASEALQPSVVLGAAAERGGSSQPAPLLASLHDGGLPGTRLPVTPIEPVETFPQRAPEARGEILEKMGGTAETERAVGLALEWFARHQKPDGRWSGEHFDDDCGKCGTPAEIHADAAMTGVVLLCYLGAGHTQMAEGPYKEVVAKGLKWLIARQAANGDLRQGETMYGQTIATVALCEALSMTKDRALALPTRNAVQFVINTAAKPRGQRTPDEDISVLGWLVMTVESARRAGIQVPRDVFDSAGRFLDSVSAGGTGRYSYGRGLEPNAAMTAEAMFVRQLLGHSREEAKMKESAEFILRTPPRWENGAPTYHWYYTTLALFEHQGEAWKQWNEAVMPELVGHQRQEGNAMGSWDPQDEWSRLGGRIYQTAICTLSLEVYYRYKPK